MSLDQRGSEHESKETKTPASPRTTRRVQAQSNLLTLAQVEHVAKLAQLALSEVEKERYREQLSSILEYAWRLQQVNTDEIPPTATVLPLENVMRSDEVQPSLPLVDVLSNAPAVEEDCFRVPVVLEGEE
jgi:aspartyl-tRNA(Asn)/glutamyl-tRNA(Gln) amidotransferase subunit C